MAFVKNAWYVACWAGDVKTGSLFHRKLLDETVVFYRKQDGEPVALQDRCPHRFVPLHLGKVEGDTIQCPYHGLEFDCSGRCTANPHGDGKIPAALRVRAYPVQEKYGIVWIWMGAGEPDVAAIPDFSMLDAGSSFQTIPGYVHMKAGLELIADNLMDLSHITYLHPGILGSPEQVGKDQVVSEEGGRIHCKRWMPDVSPPGILDLLYRRDGQPVDMWTNMSWYPPGCFVVDAGVHAIGGKREERGWYYGVHLLTPETATTTHYHFVAAIPLASGLTPEESARLGEMRRKAFQDQDKPIIEAQQMEMGPENTDFMGMKPVFISADVGAVRMRRALERMVQQERQDKREPNPAPARAEA